jgi:hypothetical protein
MSIALTSTITRHRRAPSPKSRILFAARDLRAALGGDRARVLELQRGVERFVLGIASHA